MKREFGTFAHNGKIMQIKREDIKTEYEPYIGEWIATYKGLEGRGKTEDEAISCLYESAIYSE